MKAVKRISRKYYFKQIVVCMLVNCMFFGTSMLLAEPDYSGQVAGNSINGVSQNGNTTTVDMGASNRAILEWNSFDTLSGEILQFLKAGGSFAVLNKVLKNGVTNFDGSLFGNQGTIIVIAPCGIVFGPTAIVKAHKFTASALDMANSDFMNGVYQFEGGGIGEVANYGKISAEQVALIGKKVLNAGVIKSPNGYVLMAAGDRVFLGSEGSNVVVEVDAVTVPQKPPIEGMGDVINEGTIEAAGGEIVLAAGDTFSRAIEGLDGLTVAVEAGTGRVGQFGTINADGTDGDGGSIALAAGELVALGKDSLTTANAGTNGNGGDVIVYSPDTAILAPDARVEAKGGSESGSGGFVELSGKEYVEVLGAVDTTAPKGNTGTFLIDPTNITISNNDSSPFMLWYDDPEWFFADRDASFHDNPSNLNIDILTAQLALTNVEVTTMTDAGEESSVTGWLKVLDAIEYNSDNSLTLTADDYIWTDSDAPITNHGDGGLIFQANGDVTINANLTTGGSIDIYSSDTTTYLACNKIEAGDITLHNNTVLNGSGGQILRATSGTFVALGDITKLDMGEANLRIAGVEDTYGYGIYLAGNVRNEHGSLVFEDNVNANGEGNQMFDADGSTATLWTKDITKTTAGALTLSGGRGRHEPGLWHENYGMFLYGDVEVQDGSLIIGDDDMLDDEPEELKFTAGGNLLATGDILLKKPGRFAALDEEALDKKLDGQGGQYAAILCDGWLDQKVGAGYDGGNGKITAQSWLMKATPGDLYLLGGSGELAIDLKDTVSTNKGNLWIIGNGDVQIGGDLTTFGEGGCGPGGTPCSGWETGGVLIYSHDGKIYTQGGLDDTLNVSVTGNSDHLAQIGVYDIKEYGLGYDAGCFGPIARAAIVIMSKADLRLGTGAELSAYGRYYDPEFIDGAWDVDDRAAINFLDYDGSFPPDTPRDQGVPFDLAIYAASKTGDVDVSSPVSIMSREPVLPLSEGYTLDIRPDYVCVPKGTMVIDAWNAVTFDAGVPGGLFETSLAAGDVGDRLEVCSRRSEWLNDAVGPPTRLPYAGNAGAMSLIWYGNDNSYILRGAGDDNPAIGDDAPAWVLEVKPAPAAPLPDLKMPEITGCPVETQAAAGELGITAETIQVSIGNALALNPDIQPCQACARLINAARILRDEDGSRMAATLQAFNTLAPADAPFTPEMGASIAMTFEAAAVEGVQYASVAEYIDAFVEYVTVLETELGAPVGNSTAFAMEKYGAGIAGNANIATYIEARLAGL